MILFFTISIIRVPFDFVFCHRYQSFGAKISKILVILPVRGNPARAGDHAQRPARTESGAVYSLVTDDVIQNGGLVDYTN